jgi:hypothetical protein
MLQLVRPLRVLFQGFLQAWYFLFILFGSRSPQGAGTRCRAETVNPEGSTIDGNSLEN